MQAAGCSDWTSHPARLGANPTKALVVRPAACRWKRRLSHLAQYFSAYRIDHILGFCRIWEIPGDCATGEICALHLRVIFEAGGPHWASCRAGPAGRRGDRSRSAAAVVAAAGMPAVLTVCRLGWINRAARQAALAHVVRAPLCCPAPRTLHLLPQNPAGLLGYFRPSIPITAKDLEVRGMSGPAVLERLTGAGQEQGWACDIAPHLTTLNPHVKLI